MRSYCFNCMKQTDGALFCPRCGHDINDKSAAAPYHLLPGTVLAERYLVGRYIGEGGFGITYIGLDTTLSKRVAIKEFYPSGAANRTNEVSDGVIITQGKEEFFSKGVERFMLEAKNVAAFSDEDGIVDVLDYFQANNTAYIVMEYLDGENLREYVNNHGLFKSDELINLMYPVMKSLKAMHKAGVIHRDISPDNIMYTKNGKLKLMDFGSARYYTNEERQLSVVLKQGYAPEEQYRKNGKQGPYTDVYALCATIYNCITGVIPEDSLDREINDTLKAPSKLGVKISQTHEHALMHGLALFADDRCRDMDALINEFQTTRNIYSTMDANQLKNSRPAQPRNQQPRPQQPKQQPRPQQRLQPQWQAQNVPPRNNMPPQNMPPQNMPPQNMPPQNMPPYNQNNNRPPQKNNTSLVAAVIVASIAVLAAIGVMVYFVFFHGKGDDSAQSSATQSVTEQSSRPDISGNTATDTTEAQRTTEQSSRSDISQPSKPESSVLSKDEIDSYHNSIGEKFGKDITYMDKASNAGDYDYVVTENKRVWIGTKGSFHDDEKDKDWYFFDENHNLYFVYRCVNGEQYRYYIHDDQVIRYYVGYGESQKHYDMGDKEITSSVNDIVDQAYNAYDYVANHQQ